MIQTVLFEDLVDVKIDNRGKTPPLTSAGHPLLEVNAISRNRLHPNLTKVSKFVDQETYETWFRQHLQKDDILFTTVGTIAESAIVPEGSSATIAQNILGFRFKTALINPLFALYLMRSRWFLHQIGGRTVETVQKSIKWADMRSIKITLPDLEAQKKIASILGAIDEKIELNRKMNETLEQMGQALFRHYFIDNPEIGRWGDVRISDISTYISRGISPTYDELGDSLVINQRCIRDSRLSLANARRQSKVISDAKLLKKGDVLINSTGVGTLGRVAQVDNIPDNVTVDSHVTIVRPGIDGYFFGQLMRRLEPTFERLGRGTTGQTELSRASVSDLRVKLPPKDLITKFSLELEPIRERMYSNDKEAIALTTLRETLLPGLIRGKIKVGE